MKQQFILSGVGSLTLRKSLRESLIRAKPRVVGIASAFVSRKGVEEISKIFEDCCEPECRLIAGTDNAITHPEALYAARDLGWRVKIGNSGRGIFHPKLIVAGQNVSREGNIRGVSCVYVGSSNLTNGGLSQNVECGFISHAVAYPDSASTAFGQLWADARPATIGELRNYAARFAELSRRRTVVELANLGVNDSDAICSQSSELRIKRPPANPALASEFAIGAWAGLQSFTGEYTFQVEFPKAAGKVIAQLLKGHKQTHGRVAVFCEDDNVPRQMHYGFYSDNSMFRLNIPNEVPGVAWARKNRDGIALVEKGPPGGAPLRLRVLKPNPQAGEIVGRSVALGTWGRTTTRTYGWF